MRRLGDWEIGRLGDPKIKDNLITFKWSIFTPEKYKYLNNDLQFIKRKKGDYLRST
jgi:hypothetical protein